jgi:hypothetical protein
MCWFEEQGIDVNITCAREEANGNFLSLVPYLWYVLILRRHLENHKGVLNAT